MKGTFDAINETFELYTLTRDLKLDYALKTDYTTTLDLAASYALKTDIPVNVTLTDYYTKE